MRVSPDLALCSDFFFFFLFNQQITLTTITGSNVKKTLNTELLSSQTGGEKKTPNCPLEEAKMGLHKSSYFTGLKFTPVAPRRNYKSTHITHTHTHTSYTHYTHGTRTHTYSIVYRLTHMSQETAVIPSAIKKKTGRLTNGSTHTPNTLFITHHLHKQTNTHTHARTHTLFVPAHSLLVSCYIRWLRVFSLSLSLCVAPVTQSGSGSPYLLRRHRRRKYVP